MKQINGASIILTESCNLSCMYCYEKKKTDSHINKETLIKAIDFLISHNYQNEPLKIIWFGGEPLLRFNLIKNGVQYLKEKNIEIRQQIVTNGTIYDDEIKYFLQQNENISLQISWDGSKEINDIQRGKTNLIEKNIVKFSQLNNLLSVHICVTPIMVPQLFKNIKHIISKVNRNKNFKITIRPVPEVDGWDKKTLNMFSKQYYECCEYYGQYIDKLVNCDYYFDHIGTCGAGKNFATITPNGDIYACHRFYFNEHSEKYKLGDIYNGFIQNETSCLLEDYSVDDMEQCLECDCYQFCDRCIAENNEATNNIMKPSEKRCKIYNIIFNSILTYITKHYPEKLLNYDEENKIAKPVHTPIYQYKLPLVKFKNGSEVNEKG